ncbi:MAG: YidB family protein [Burkholderiaceae bacterium]|jgi:uncharacterized protein YidB (DUF937 family)|nr:YidB family protein [Burkholderiaceae bacterium]
MFEVLIREAAARFGVGDKALPLVQMLLAAMMAKDTGGLAGFLEKFKAAGLGPLVQSWLGGGEDAQPIGNTQVEAVLGTSGGLLPALTAQLGLPRDKITEAIGYLLPALVGRLTPGGALPASPPAEIAGYAQAGQGLLAQAEQAMQTAQRASAASIGGGKKWLPWVIVIIIALAILYAWNANRRAAPSQSKPAAALPNIATPMVRPPAHVQPPVSGAVFGGSAPRKPASATAATPAPIAAPADSTAAPASAAN